MELEGVSETAALLRPSQLRALARAVYNSSDHGEDNYIEWKSQLDLTAKIDLEKLAKNIIAFANRDPSLATRRFAGYGYVLVGVAPTKLAGVKTVDPERLVGQIAPYFGNEIRWSPEYVKLNNVDVLVIVIDPPRWGDPIHSAHKPIDSKPRGTIFVRRTGRTEPADHEELKMLQARFAPTLKVRTRQQRLVGSLAAFLLFVALARDPALKVYTEILTRPVFHPWTSVAAVVLLATVFWFVLSNLAIRTFIAPERTKQERLHATKRTVALIGPSAIIAVATAYFSWWEYHYLDVMGYPSYTNLGTRNYTVYGPFWAITIVVAITGSILGVSAATGRWPWRRIASRLTS
jgi:hypothetical protein